MDFLNIFLDFLNISIGSVLLICVLLGTGPIFTSLYQFLLVGLHAFTNHYDESEMHFPAVSIIIPAWNEGSVIGITIDTLLKLEYPKDRLRIYVVDDASSDDTPDIVKAKAKLYPENVFHLRRENGGEGKAHTLNYGIKILLSEPWSEAFMIIDADVLYEPNSLRKMSRHLADPNVGSVTAYIKEGSFPGNLISRFIAFEYITAQAASRRSQNVLNSLACLAGGAQLHSRENLIAIGGKIDTSSLAEDTFTTFKTQLNGRKAIFDGNATVWAEEPGDLVGLWKQRLRWARGNVQVTIQFRHIWCNKKNGKQLGSISFALLWFAVFLMPVLITISSLGLVGLLFLDLSLSWFIFKQFWIFNGIVYLFITLYSYLIDIHTAKRAWLEGLIFPGIISLCLIANSFYPNVIENFIRFDEKTNFDEIDLSGQALLLFIYLWLILSMGVAFFAYYLDKIKAPYALSTTVLLFGGYGPLLCAITVASYISEFKGEEMTWDKTEKSGKVNILN
jgi:cellulose synthase/poly-beta-1,6-N-acetylglucosamine synthase-like glycosyltransferase